MQEPSSILIYGHDTTLLDTRRWVLERAGYRVSTALEEVSMMEAMEAVDVLLLCHTLSMEKLQQALDLAARLHPKVKRLSFVRVTDREDVEGETIDSFVGAVGLLGAVRKILNQNTKF